MSKYDKVINHIESFKGKFETPSNEGEYDFTQFVIPATDELPCLVIMPYNGVMADFSKDTEKSENHEAHDLLVDSLLIKLENKE